MKTQTTYVLAALAVCCAVPADADPGTDFALYSEADTPDAPMFGARLSPDALWNSRQQVIPRYEKDGSDLVELVRGQSPTPTYDDGTGTTPYYGDSGIYNTDPNTQYVTPTNPTMVDPFMNPQALQPQVFPGVNGPQPYRYGWTLRNEFVYMSGQSVSGGGAVGNLSITGMNVEAQEAMPLGGGWVFVHTPEYWWRGFDGPNRVNVKGNGLPGSVHHLGWDLKWQTPSVAGWGAEFDFHPSINSDFDKVGRNAWIFDGRGALLWQWNPSFTVVGGVMYWDRVRDRILPYGGVIWNPNQLWQFRIMYPETQLKFFLGNYHGMAKWFYARVENHSEAYQVQLNGGGSSISSQIELVDWRATMGIQGDSGYIATFVEAGWVFGRTARLRNSPGFNIGSGFITRAGVRF